MASLQDLSLEQLRAHTVKTFRRGGGSRPDVLLIRADGEEAVLKDFSRADPWFQRVVGPLSVRREARALRQLDGARGVPRLLRVVNRDALLLEYVPGTSAREVPPWAPVVMNGGWRTAICAARETFSSAPPASRTWWISPRISAGPVPGTSRPGGGMETYARPPGARSRVSSAATRPNCSPN